ncbi:MAG: TetR/AcrR family transcriptional regulator, partial [Acidimicrobiales bacterium]
MAPTVGRTSPAPAPGAPTGPPTAVPAGERRLTRRGLNTRNRLVEAAGEVFNSKPYTETRITDITARAGVSTGSFYTYFESKEALFRVVAQQALDEMLAAPRRDPHNTEGNPVRDIAYASRRYFHTCRERRVIAQSIELLRSSDTQIRMRRRETLLRGVKRAERWIRRFQDLGTCDANIDPWYTALALQAMNVNLAYDQLVHRDDVDDIEALVAAVTPIWARA